MTDNQPSLLKCLWLDVRSSIQIDETPAAFQRSCEIIRGRGFDGARLEREQPDFVVLEFDYPSRQDLSRAVAFKAEYSQVPMVVVSVQHSEALVLWFFRARFYDFLIQPLSAAEAGRCLSNLHHVKELKRNQAPRRSSRFSDRPPSEASSQASVPARLQPALSLVERSYHQRLRVDEVAEACGLPAFRFGREFKEQFGIAFRDYVLRYRIREACRLLRNPRASVTEVGYSVGFSEPSYFTKMFKKLVGLCPSEVVGVSELDYCIEPGESSSNYQLSSAKS